MSLSKHCLILLLDAKLRTAILPSNESGDILFNSIRLIDQGHGAFMGFHDWLRQRSLPKRVIGVRFWPHEASYMQNSEWLNRPYISPLKGDKGLEIWFR